MSELTDVDRLFNGRHFDREVIVLGVRWYLRDKISLRDFVGEGLNNPFSALEF